MVDENFYIGAQYNEISKIASQFGEYNGFKNRYAELISKKANDEEWNNFLIHFFKKVLEDAITHFLDKINKDKKLSCNAQKEKKELEEIKEKIILNNLSLIEMHQLKTKINNNLELIYNQRELIKIINKEKWKDRVIGFVIGLVGGFVLYKLGFS